MNVDHPSIDLRSVGRRVVIATHRRSGTHLTIDLLRKQFRELQARRRLGEPFDTLYVTLEAVAHIGMAPGSRIRKGLSEAQAVELMKRAERPLIKTHALPDFAQWKPDHAEFVEKVLQEADIIYVHRDGRDVMCSLHAYMQAFAPETRTSISNFMRQEYFGMNRVQFWKQHVQRWRDTPGVHSFSFKDIVRRTRETLEEIGREIGLTPLYREPLLPRKMRGRWHGRLMRVLSRNPESTAILGAERAKLLKWREAFTPEDRAFFHEQAGDLLIELGYEDSDAWVTGDAP